VRQVWRFGFIVPPKLCRLKLRQPLAERTSASAAKIDAPPARAGLVGIAGRSGLYLRRSGAARKQELW